MINNKVKSMRRVEKAVSPQNDQKSSYVSMNNMIRPMPASRFGTESLLEMNEYILLRAERSKFELAKHEQEY